MRKRGGPQFFPILVTIIVVVMVIAGLISIGRAIFNNQQSATEAESSSDAGRQALLDSSEDSSIKMIARGPIVSDENHRSYEIYISPEKRSMNIYRGYLESISQGKTYANNVNAYEQFAHALDKANYMKGSAPTDKEKDDVRGICATGYVYEYFVLKDDKTVKRLWSSTCEGSRGSLQASSAQVNNLFREQIPAYKDLNPFRQTGMGSLRL